MEKDDRPSKSLMRFSSAGKDAGVWTMEVRSLDYGAPTSRLGDLQLRGSLDGRLTASIGHLMYGDEFDMDDDDSYGL